MGIFSVDLNNINLDDANFHENDLKTIIHVRPLAWHNKFEKRKAFKKNIKKELIPVACHPTRQWDWCMPEDKKKEKEPFFIDERSIKLLNF